MLRFVQEEECINTKHPLITNTLQDGTADSDTNSHCALILEESTQPALNHLHLFQQQRQDGKSVSSNAGNIVEMREFSKRSFFQGIRPVNRSLTTTTTNTFTIPFKRTWLWTINWLRSGILYMRFKKFTQTIKWLKKCIPWRVLIETVLSIKVVQYSFFSSKKIGILLN